MPQGEYLQYGGQAIIEGVMMRSPKYFAVACRAPNGEIVLKTEPLEKSWIGRQKWLKLPFLRGSLAILDAMALGYRALRFAADIQLKPEYMKPEDREKYEAEQAAKAAKKGDRKTGPTPQAAPASDSVASIQIGAALVFGVGLGLVLFVFLPNLLAEWIPAADSTWRNVVSGIIKVILFLGYVWLIGLAPDIRRLFQYHGAEHKAINVMEADQDLNMDNVLQQTRLHPRCGTSFAIIVLLVSLVVFTYVPRYPLGHEHGAFVNTLIRFGIELVILPIIAGLSYELLRVAGRMKNKTLMKVLFWPGLMTQYLTTREPVPDQAEVALISLRAVIHAEESGELVEDANLLMRATPAVATA
jgi:uncharacterized protein YqhQ